MYASSTRAFLFLVPYTLQQPSQQSGKGLLRCWLPRSTSIKPSLGYLSCHLSFLSKIRVWSSFLQVLGRAFLRSASVGRVKILTMLDSGILCLSDTSHWPGAYSLTQIVWTLYFSLLEQPTRLFRVCFQGLRRLRLYVVTSDFLEGIWSSNFSFIKCFSSMALPYA